MNTDGFDKTLKCNSEKRECLPAKQAD